MWKKHYRVLQHSLINVTFYCKTYRFFPPRSDLKYYYVFKNRYYICDKVSDMIENKLMLHSVLLRFNDREQEAFNQLITILHRDFYYLAERFCRGTRLMPEDLVQDVLIKIWEKKSMKFDSVQGLKLYVYVALKNRATDNAIRSNRQKKYLDSQSVIEQIAPEIIETEVLSSLNNAINTLPRECAKVLRLHLDGWNIKEIAEKLGKAKSTVYRQRQDSIEIMRKKLSEEIFLIFF